MHTLIVYLFQTHAHTLSSFSQTQPRSILIPSMCAHTDAHPHTCKLTVCFRERKVSALTFLIYIQTPAAIYPNVTSNKETHTHAQVSGWVYMHDA